MLLLLGTTAFSSGLAAENAVSGPPVQPLDFATAMKTAPQVDLALSMAAAPCGDLYFGTEENGLYRYDAANKAWRSYMPGNSGLGEANVTALLSDGVGRVWAGHISHGVSVFNGETWRNYDSMTGPLGARVWAMALCPTDGSVWIATDLGLTRYSPDRDVWSYYTRGDGLPTDEFSSLAFGADGTLYGGTQYQGVAIARPGDNYRSWKVIQGPGRMPNTPVGKSLPSNAINCMLVSGDGTIYVGTQCGLAWSNDKGESWQFVRGRDWEENVNGRYQPQSPEGDAARAILAEDWVSTLAQGAEGTILVGYRRGGCELVNVSVSKMVEQVMARCDMAVNCAMWLPGAGAAVGTYGGGVSLWDGGLTKVGTASLASAGKGVVAHPSPAKSPDVEQLKTMLQRVESLPVSRSVAGFLGDDWSTQGDWICRYGRQRAVLCGAENPMDHDYGYGEPYSLAVCTGLHRQGPMKGAWSWLQAERSDDPRWLYDPCVDTRRIGEWNDGSFAGEKYPPSWEGPDLWLMVEVPAGIHRVSLYFLNKDGQSGPNQRRDYQLDLIPYSRQLDQASSTAPLAQTRVRNFWYGVYKSFVVSEGKYWLRIQRNGSFVTILGAVFFDRLEGPESQFDKLPRVGMGACVYGPPDLPTEAESTPVIAAAAALMAQLDHAYGREGGIAIQKPYRILALRAALAAGAKPELLANWRWSIPVWTQKDREGFAAKMDEAQITLVDGMERLKQQVTTRRKTAEHE